MDAPGEAFPLPEGCDEGYIVANGVRLHYVAAGSGPLRYVTWNAVQLT